MKTDKHEHKAAAKQQHQITPGRVSHTTSEREVKTVKESARSHGHKDKSGK